MKVNHPAIHDCFSRSDDSFTSSPFSSVTWHFLAICPSLQLSAEHFSLSSCPIPLSSPFHPDVNAFIMWSMCTSCWSVPPHSPPIFSPSPRCLSGYCVSACQTWAYGVPSCQHMPGGFSMPVLARTRMCVFFAKAGMLLFAEIRDRFPGFFSPPVTLCLSVSIVYCTLSLLKQ